MNEQNSKYLFIASGIVSMSVVRAIIGSLQGLWLSSRVLSPLVAGGVLGFVTSALLSTSFMLIVAKLGDLDVKEAALKNATQIVAAAVTSGLIGVGLGFAANAIFPGVMLANGITSFGRCNNRSYSTTCRFLCN